MGEGTSLSGFIAGDWRQVTTAAHRARIRHRVDTGHGLEIPQVPRGVVGGSTARSRMPCRRTQVLYNKASLSVKGVDVCYHEDYPN